LAGQIVGLRPKWTLVLIIAATFAYGILIGPLPSVVRSTAMTFAACVAGLRDRHVRSSNVLGLAGLITLGHNPSFLFDVGCQLSFLGVAPFFCLVPWVDRQSQSVRMALRFQLPGPEGLLDELERRYEPRWKSAMRGLASNLLKGLLASTVVWFVGAPLAAL